MSMLVLGSLFGIVTLLFMFSGAPIAFALGSVAVLLICIFPSIATGLPDLVMGAVAAGH